MPDPLCLNDIVVDGKPAHIFIGERRLYWIMRYLDGPGTHLSPNEFVASEIPVETICRLAQTIDEIHNKIPGCGKVGVAKIKQFAEAVA